VTVIEPGQIAVVEIPHQVTMEEVHRMKETWAAATDGERAVFIGSGMRLAGVIRPRPWKRAR
jgi:hypothetical protein